MKRTFFIVLLAAQFSLMAQPFPDTTAGPYSFVVYGPDTPGRGGEEWHWQELFFTFPISYKGPIVFHFFSLGIDPETDGVEGDSDTKTQIIIYGGKGAVQNHDQIRPHPSKEGKILFHKTYRSRSHTWETSDQLYCEKGDLHTALAGTFGFRVLIRAQKGDDRNVFRVKVSSSEDPLQSLPIFGANAYAYRLLCRLPSGARRKEANLDFLASGASQIQVENLGFSTISNGSINLTRPGQAPQAIKLSGNGSWARTALPLIPRPNDRPLTVKINIAQSVRMNDLFLSIRRQEVNGQWSSYCPIVMYPPTN